MKPTWDKLAEEFNSGSKVLVADVDCTAGGKDLCETYGVQGFPTIKYFNPPDEEGEDYEGGRGFDELKAFAEKLGPGCSASTIENCTEEQKAEIAEVQKMAPEKISEEIETIKKTIKDAEEAHEKLLEGLQAQYEKSNKGVEELKATSKPRLKLLKAASAPAGGAGGKDEV